MTSSEQLPYSHLLGNPDFTHPVPRLVSNYVELRSISVTGELGAIPPLFEDVETLERYLLEVARAWACVFDEEKFKDALATADQVDSQRYLKNVRQFGLILKTSYLFFHAHHAAPEQVREFVSLLGIFNDYITTEHRHVYAIALCYPKMLSHLSQEITYQPTELTKFQEYLNQTILKIKSLAAQKTLIMDDYHTLRKRIRSLMTILQIPASQELNQPPHHLFFILYNFSKTMGDIHDAILQETLDQPDVYHRQRLSIPPQIKADLDHVLRICEKLSTPKTK